MADPGSTTTAVRGGKRSWSVEGVDPDAAAVAKAAADAAGMTISEWLSQAILNNTGYREEAAKPARRKPSPADVSGDFAESETILRPQGGVAPKPSAPAPAGPDSEEDAPAIKPDVLRAGAPWAPSTETRKEAFRGKSGDRPASSGPASEGEILAPDAPDPDFGAAGDGDDLDGENGENAGETAEDRQIREAMEEIRRTIVFASAVPVPGDDKRQETPDTGANGAASPDRAAPEARHDEIQEDPDITLRPGRREPIETAPPEVEDKGPPLPFAADAAADTGAQPAPSSGSDDSAAKRSSVEVDQDKRITPEGGMVVASDGERDAELPLEFNPHAPGADYRLAPDDLAALRTIVAAGGDPDREERSRRTWIWFLLLVIAAGIAAGVYFYPDRAAALRDRITSTVSELWSSIRGDGDAKKTAPAGTSGDTAGTGSSSSGVSVKPPPGGTVAGATGGAGSTSTVRMPEGRPPMPPGQNPGWYKQAAEAGSANAQYVLATLFLHGNGIPKDTERAAFWFAKAADQGLPQAQYSLAQLFERGEGVTADMNQAVEWYQLAARQRHGQAQLRLGELYLVGGSDINRDFEKAHLWLIRASKSGVPDAQYALGVMYRDGLGIPRDNAVAFKWFTYAAQEGHEKAEQAVRELDGQLTGSERAEARTLLREPRPSPNRSIMAGAVQPPPSGSSAGTGGSGASVIVEKGPTPNGKTLIIRPPGIEPQAGESGAGASGAAGNSGTGTSTEGSAGNPPAPPEAKGPEPKEEGVKKPEAAEEKPPETASKPPPPKILPKIETQPKPVARPNRELADIQKLLAELHLDPGNTKGIASTKTTRAIRLYQKTAGLPVTGKPSPALLRHLRSALGGVSKVN